VPRPGNEGAQPLGGEARDASAPRELQQILAVVADKWAFLVIEQLRGRTLRFSELSSAVPCISGRMLTKTLRQLERDGLVSRTLHAAVPPHVEYRLTELGLTALPSVRALCEWARDRQDEIHGNRSHYDATAPRHRELPSKPR
jgi:DNA-binding HxlR family transcriptional regulator